MIRTEDDIHTVARKRTAAGVNLTKLQWSLRKLEYAAKVKGQILAITGRTCTVD